MKRTLNFRSDGEKYILENTNPNEKKEAFTINMDEMQFDTNKFYEYVFSDMTEKVEIEIVNMVSGENEKSAKRVCATIEDICKGVMDKMNSKCFE